MEVKKSCRRSITSKILKLSLSLTIIALVFSCAKPDNELETKVVIDTNFVSKLEAREFAMAQLNLQRKLSNKKKASTASVSREGIEVIEVGTQNPSFYIINYSNGGFAIVSADKRLEPILAFSETNSFNVTSSSVPSGLIAWMSNIDDAVISLRKSSASVDKNKAEHNRSLWKSGQKLSFDPDNPPLPESNCTQEGAVSSEYIQTGPLTSTTWGQTGGYNANSPDKGCQNGRLPPTGCVATAMAQIMRFHQKPSSYNWSSMLNNNPTSETARLMRDAGSSVDMDYGCDGSSAKTSKAATALVNNFGYTSAQFSDYNHNTVVSEIKANRPVILSGGKNSGWWIFGIYTDGHAWVCDGLMEVKHYKCAKLYTPMSPNPILMKQQTSSSLFLHMNWGWSGAFDGYFAYNNFNPSSYTFNYTPRMITNIKP